MSPKDYVIKLQFGYQNIVVNTVKSFSKLQNIRLPLICYLKH